MHRFALKKDVHCQSCTHLTSVCPIHATHLDEMITFKNVLSLKLRWPASRHKSEFQANDRIGINKLEINVFIYLFIVKLLHIVPKTI